MLTRRMAAPMIRRGGRRMRQMHELRAENARLTAQVDVLEAEIRSLRLQVVAEIAANAGEDDWLPVDDIDEPHGAGSVPTTRRAVTPDERTHVREMEAE